MSEAQTLIRKVAKELAAEHPGWSARKISEEIDLVYPDAVDALFMEQRRDIFRWWVSDRIIGTHRRAVRQGLRDETILAAMSPDGQHRLYQIGEMTGDKVVELGRRYIDQSNRLRTLGQKYIQIGQQAGRKKIKNVFSEEQLEDILREDVGT